MGLLDLLASGDVGEVHDLIDDQLVELVRCLRPGDPLTDGQLAAAVDEVCEGADRRHFGTWVWHPWSGRLVHVLPEREFRRVRTDRNRDKITSAEQERLLGCRIGVIGLSVGNSAALTCVMEGVGGSFRLADFDKLGLRVSTPSPDACPSPVCSRVASTPWRCARRARTPWSAPWGCWWRSTGATPC